MLVEADQKFFERNYDEFVHLQYLSEIMKLVPELTTPDGTERVDNIIITTDKNGENPLLSNMLKMVKKRNCTSNLKLLIE